MGEGRFNLHEVVFMTDQEINVAIAEWCGSKTPFHRFPEETFDGDWKLVSDYCSDLNAIREAEMVLRGTDYQQDNEVIFYKRWHEYQFFLMETNGVSAPARIRAEALLRTIGKWKE
jgi:hypothetical protein